MAGSFTIECENLNGIMTLIPNGNIDDVSRCVFQTQLNDLYHQDYTLFIIDLSKVNYLVSSCLGLISSTSNMLESKNGKLCLCNPTDSVRRILNITQQYNRIKVYNTREEAFAACKDLINHKEESMGNKISVAIIDDDPDTVLLFRDAMVKRDYQIFATSNVNKFFSSLRRSLPDVVVVDMIITAMPGWEICRKIRSEKLFENIKIIVISGILSEEDIETFSLNADLCLIKPVDFDLLDSTIRQMVKT